MKIDRNSLKAAWLLLVLQCAPLLGGCDSPSASGPDSEGQGGDSASQPDPQEPKARGEGFGNSVGGAGGAGSVPQKSDGCGTEPPDSLGGTNVEVHVTITGEDRSMYLSIPSTYDPDIPHSLIVAYPTANKLGEDAQTYLQLESSKVSRGAEIFAYLSPYPRFNSGSTIAFALGPYAAPYDGNEDILFTEEAVEYIADNYCLDENRRFVTGYGWGGDMANVVACFTNLFRAAAPLGANGPYWFYDDTDPITCTSQTAIWNFYGLGDIWFEDDGENGREVRDFWVDDRSCDGVTEYESLGIENEECEEYLGCASTVRSCLFDASFGSNPPDYFASEVMGFFRGR